MESIRRESTNSSRREPSSRGGAGFSATAAKNVRRMTRRERVAFMLHEDRAVWTTPWREPVTSG
jgi:hypothetical protein